MLPHIICYYSNWTAKELKKVKSVLAVDINKEAVDFVKKQKIKAIQSDLFSKVEGK